MADVETRKISVEGSARFKWIEGVGEGQRWDEQFVYVLDFDDEAKITDYQVWADTGAAYLAQLGKVNNLREVSRILILISLILIRHRLGLGKGNQGFRHTSWSECMNLNELFIAVFCS